MLTFAPLKKEVMFNKRVKIKELLTQEPAGQEITVMPVLDRKSVV